MPLLDIVHQGWREFRARPAVTAIAVLMLALGVAGATSMFTILASVGAVMVPPGVDATRVGRIAWTYAESGTRNPLTPAEYAAVNAARVAGIEVLSAWADETAPLDTDGPDLQVKRITATFFPTFGFRVSAGRGFTADDQQPGRDRVAVVAEALARRQPHLAVGGTIHLAGEAYAIVGVLPDRHWFPTINGTDVWVPLAVARDGTPLAASVTVTARLAPSASPDGVQAAVRAVGNRLASGSATAEARRLRLVTLAEDVSTRTGFGLVGLVGPSVIVLLIACGNVANLLLARAARRERETAVRVALGAGRVRLLVERMAESACLGVTGGALGLALSVALVALLRAWVGSFESAASAAQSIHLDARAVAFSLAVTLAIPFIVGLVPAMVASRPNLLPALQQGVGRPRPARGPYGGRDLLVIVEIGLAVVLVVCAGMFARFFAELSNIHWGFDASRMVAIELSFGRERSTETQSRLLAQVVEAVRRTPGVAGAASGGLTGVRLRPDHGRIEFEHCASGGAGRAVSVPVGPTYFSTIGLPVLRGRAIEGQDVAGAPLAAVLSASQAERCWPGQEAVGRRVRLGSGPGTRVATIVGVAADAMTTRAVPDMPQGVYLSAAQGGSVPTAVFARTAGDPSAVIGTIAAAVRKAAPPLRVEGVGRVDEAFRRMFDGAPMMVGLIGGFGAFALLLGALGVFSVTSYTVAERTREIGIRIALGASRVEVLRLVMGQAATIVLIGTAVSVAGTLALTRLGFREMADLAMTDVRMWTGVTLLLAAVAVAASLSPARRATRVDPVEALRTE